MHHVILLQIHQQNFLAELQMPFEMTCQWLSARNATTFVVAVFIESFSINYISNFFQTLIDIYTLFAINGRCLEKGFSPEGILRKFGMSTKYHRRKFWKAILQGTQKKSNNVTYMGFLELRQYNIVQKLYFNAILSEEHNWKRQL